MPKNLTYIFLVVLYAIANTAESRQLAVPEEFETIAEAINQSENGDSVIVAPGVYLELVDYRGKNITLLGSPEDPTLTVINGGNEHQCVRFRRQETRDAVLDGFTLRSGAEEYGGGMLISSSHPTIRNCIISSNSASYGAGIAIRGNSLPDISFCIIRDNDSNLSGGGIYSSDGQNIPISNCTITRNRANWGGGIYASNSRLIVNNTILWENAPLQIATITEEVSIAYSVMQNGLDGVDGLIAWWDGNIEDNPSFVNSDENDFSLRMNSPCINSGNPEFPDDPDGTRSDIGARHVFLEVDPTITFSATDFDFGIVRVGESDTLHLTITNIGQQDLEIIDVFIEGDYFFADFGVLDTIRSRESIDVEFTFVPRESGIFDGRFFINSNDPANDEVDIWLTGEGLISPAIFIEPTTVNVAIDSGEVAEYAINITNEGGSDLNWRMYSEYIEPVFSHNPTEPDVPERDDGGDLLATFRVPYTTSYGLAWDGEYMWGIAMDNRRLIKMNPENEEVVADYQIHVGPRALTFDGDYFWTSSYNSSNNIYLYNLEGELVDRFELPCRSISGLAYDHNSRVYVNSWDEQRIYVVDKNSREVIADFDMLLEFRRNDYKISRLEWVPGHFDGHLWAIVGNAANGIGFAVRVDINENWQTRERQRFQLHPTGHTGIAHDGADLWHGGAHDELLWYIYDDGLRDMRWLEIDPEQGTLLSDEDTDVIMILNAEGLDDGIYGSKVRVVSNDPENPEVEILISLFVGDVSGIGDELEDPSIIIPVSLSLHQNYPNPFNTETRIQYSMPEAGTVSLSVYDVFGNQLCKWDNVLVQQGTQTVTWDASDYPAGVYFAGLTTSIGSAAIKMLLVK